MLWPPIIIEFVKTEGIMVIQPLWEETSSAFEGTFILLQRDNFTYFLNCCILLRIPDTPLEMHEVSIILFGIAEEPTGRASPHLYVPVFTRIAKSWEFQAAGGNSLHLLTILITSYHL